ncbi:MAG: 50S ribosomal protein L3 [Patescibacteria group bacterium]
MAGLIAKKIGMSRVFHEDGTEIPVTYLQVDPNVIVRTRTKDRDGYDAVVLGVGGKKWKTRKGKEHTRFLVQKEFPVPSLEGVTVGSEVTVEVIPAESTVSVVGISKGKGFAGVIKRHHFSSGPSSHGSHHHREPGSVGMRAKPGKVLRGKRMPGHMGFERVTIKHRPVIVSDATEKLLAIKGAIPGPKGAFVFITKEEAVSSKKE